jgi:hypothetical protein
MEFANLPSGDGVLLAGQTVTPPNDDKSWYTWFFTIPALLMLFNAVLGSALFEVFWRKTSRHRNPN